MPRSIDGRYGAKIIVDKTPMQAINAANKVLGPRFITKYGSKQGVLVLGKQVPFGVGAVLGGGGNALFATLTVKTAKEVFGDAPESWVTEPGDEDVSQIELNPRS